MNTSNEKRDREFLRQLQSLPMQSKFQRTLGLIGEWHNYYKNNVVVSLSGGKDSTVLADIDAIWCKAIKKPMNLCFSNTGLEYPEIQRHVRNLKDHFEKKYGIEVNLKTVTPEMRFDEVVSRYGYPLISKEVSEAIYYARRICVGKETIYKRKALQGQAPTSEKKRIELLEKNPDAEINDRSQFNKEKWFPLSELPIPISHYCCAKMKKQPIKKWQHENKLFPILGTLAEESRLREAAWIRHGCNAFDGYAPSSQPLSFWTEQDILQYIVEYNVPIASVYGDIVNVDEFGNEYEPVDMFGNVGCNLKCTGCQRTGCIFCGFGFHLEKGETRFQRLAKTHPKQYEYCIGGGQWVDNPHYDPTAPKYDGEWKNWNPKKIWTPSKKGLGMGKVFEMVNKIYGKDFYRWE